MARRRLPFGRERWQLVWAPIGELLVLSSLLASLCNDSSLDGTLDGPRDLRVWGGPRLSYIARLEVDGVLPELARSPNVLERNGLHLKII